MYRLSMSRKSFALCTAGEYIGGAVYAAAFALLFALQPECMDHRIVVNTLLLNVLCFMVILLGIREFINERINRLKEELSRGRLAEGYGALTAAGFLGTAFSLAAFIMSLIKSPGPGSLYIFIMLLGALGCGICSRLIFKAYKPITQ